MSNLFETQSAKYFNSIGIDTKSSTIDKDPDLFFLQSNQPCEIKVTGVNTINPTKCKWMGGKYSKRTSDFIFVMWNYQEGKTTLLGEETSGLYLNVIQCFVDEKEWKTIDNGNENYYATVFTSDSILSRDHKVLVGEYSNEFKLRKYE